MTTAPTRREPTTRIDVRIADRTLAKVDRLAAWHGLTRSGMIQKAIDAIVYDLPPDTPGAA